MPSPFSLIQQQIDTQTTLREEKQGSSNPIEDHVARKQTGQETDPLPQNPMTKPSHLVVNESKTASTGFNNALQSGSDRVIYWDSSFKEFLKLVRDSISPNCRDYLVIYSKALDVIDQALQGANFDSLHPDTRSNFTRVRGEVQVLLVRLITRGMIRHPEDFVDPKKYGKEEPPPSSSYRKLYGGSMQEYYAKKRFLPGAWLGPGHFKED